MSVTSESWLTFVVSLPSAATTARMRIWRAVKALGCAALRDGAYLLPAYVEQAAQLQMLADDALQDFVEKKVVPAVVRIARREKKACKGDRPVARTLAAG